MTLRPAKAGEGGPLVRLIISGHAGRVSLPTPD